MGHNQLEDPLPFIGIYTNIVLVLKLWRACATNSHKIVYGKGSNWLYLLWSTGLVYGKGSTGIVTFPFTDQLL